MIQYQVAITTLVDFWRDSEPDEALRREALANLQNALANVAGEEARWSEASGVADPPEFLDVGALYALRAAAAWYEQHGRLDGFEATDAPWDHPVFDAYDDGARAERFAQLLESDADVAAFVPAKLPEIYFLSEYDDDEEGEEIALGSLSALLRELDTLAVMLQVPEGLDPYDTDTPAFDENVDPNAPVNWALAMLRRCAYKALKRGLPLVIYAVEVDDEDVEE